jgi:uncharacterized protein YyaL (SSP411 family)
MLHDELQTARVYPYGRQVTGDEFLHTGDAGAADAQESLNVACSAYRPYRVAVYGSAGQEAPLIQDRGKVDGRSAGYVCRNSVCQALVTEPEALRMPLEQQGSYSGPIKCSV